MQDGKGRAPLHLAAEKGVVSIVWPLLSHGASVHARWVGWIERDNQLGKAIKVQSTVKAD